MRAKLLNSVQDGRNRYGTMRNETIKKPVSYSIDIERAGASFQLTIKFDDGSTKHYTKFETEADARQFYERGNFRDFANSGSMYCASDEGQSKLLHEWVDGKCKTCGVVKAENSSCPSCKCDMGDHGSDGRCDSCGAQCG